MYVPAQWRLPMEGEYNPSGLRWMPINDGMAVFDEEYDDRMTQVPPSVSTLAKYHLSFMLSLY